MRQSVALGVLAGAVLAYGLACLVYAAVLLFTSAPPEPIAPPAPVASTPRTSAPPDAPLSARAVPTRAARSRPSIVVPKADTLDWAALAQCESSGNPKAVSPSGKYRGLYQFGLRTWRSVGGTGDPIDASAAEQTRRAELLYAAHGRSPWPFCGRRL